MDKQISARLQTTDGAPVMFKGVKVNGELRGLMLEARIEQRFCNQTDKNVEVVYTFPLPWRAVLLAVDVQLGAKHLTGVVVEKKRAEAEYEEAISEGDTAIMLEKNHDQSYTLNLGNLAAQEDCMVTLRYAQTLQFEQRGLRLLIPTVIAPRYGDAIVDGGLSPHQAPSHNLLADYPFDIELRLYGDLAGARVASPSHPISVARSAPAEGGVLTVSLTRRGALDRDFLLVVDQMTQASPAIVARDCVDPKCVVALASFCPRIRGDVPANIAVKILVDCSGSMAEDSIEAAKRSLQSVIAQFAKGDRFSLSRFGSSVVHRSRGMWQVTVTTRMAAQRWVDSLQADLGGTEMEAALASTFKLAQTVPSDVLIVTDGEIDAIDSTIKTAKASGHRLFVVGIGSSPAEIHLRRLAEETGGACDFVAPGEAVEPAVLRMFARLRSPRLAGLRIEWPAGATPEWASPVPAYAFDGDTVNVFGLFRSAPSGEVRLLGTDSPVGKFDEIGRAGFDPLMASGDTLTKLMGMARIDALQADFWPASFAQIAQLAVTYQLVTDYTNFLLVHQRAEAEKPVDMPELHKVDQMVPAGWGGMGTVMALKYNGSHIECRVANRGVPIFRTRGPNAWDDTVKFCAFDTLVPDFLREQTDTIDYGDRRYWSDSSGYSGLTPLGLSEWLRITPVADWPQTYQELLKAGLGAWVVEWIELVIAIHEGRSLPEQSVIEAFLYVMSQRDTRESMMKSLGLVQSVKVTAQRLNRLFSQGVATARPTFDARLVENISLALDGMTADAWPDTVYAFDA